METMPMLTEAQREAGRQARLNEKGTEPPCPFCNRPRVKRSDYIRCNGCGVNWLAGEDITHDPRQERFDELRRSLGLIASKPGVE